MAHRDADQPRATIRNATKADTMEVGRLFVATDEPIFERAFGPAAALGRYLEGTFDEGGILAPDTVRVAVLGDEVVGICVSYAKDYPSCHGMSFTRRLESGIDRLSEAFDDTMSDQMQDIRMATDMGFAYIDCLCVDEGHRGQGIGRALLDDALLLHGSSMLYCREDNEVALSLYKGMGFRMMGMTFGISEDEESLGPVMLMLAIAVTEGERGAERTPFELAEEPDDPRQGNRMPVTPRK